MIRAKLAPAKAKPLNSQNKFEATLSLMIGHNLKTSRIADTFFLHQINAIGQVKDYYRSNENFVVECLSSGLSFHTIINQFAALSRDYLSTLSKVDQGTSTYAMVVYTKGDREFINRNTFLKLMKISMLPKNKLQIKTLGISALQIYIAPKVRTEDGGH